MRHGLVKQIVTGGALRSKEWLVRGVRASRAHSLPITVRMQVRVLVHVLLHPLPLFCTSEAECNVGIELTGECGS